jgi:hypothetical protein
MRPEIGRQHDDEDDQEHVRHARAVRHGRHVPAPGALGKFVGKVGVEQVAERQGDAERRQDMAEYGGGRELHHAQAQTRQHDDVQHDIGKETEKGVPVAWNPPGWAKDRRAGHRSVSCCVYALHALESASSSADDGATQPKMPPWAFIIARAASWKCGKYEPVQSDSTRQSKPRSLASRTVV